MNIRQFIKNKYKDNLSIRLYLTLYPAFAFVKLGKLFNWIWGFNPWSATYQWKKRIKNEKSKNKN